MSRAAEWAKRLSDADSAKRAVERDAPTPFCLHLDSRNRIDLSVSPDGKPILTLGTENHRPDVARLVDMAKWILAMYEPK